MQKFCYSVVCASFHLNSLQNVIKQSTKPQFLFYIIHMSTDHHHKGVYNSYLTKNTHNRSKAWHSSRAEFYMALLSKFFTYTSMIFTQYLLTRTKALLLNMQCKTNLNVEDTSLDDEGIDLTSLEMMKR